MFSFFANQSAEAVVETRERQPRRATPTISFSISYVRVCEWAAHPDKFSRPSETILAQAAEHALRLGDKYILGKIEEAKTEWLLVDKTITPKDFPKSKQSTQRHFCGPEKPMKIVEEQSKRIAIFSSRGTYAPEKIVSSKKPREKVKDEARVITTTYSVTPNSKEVIKIKDGSVRDRFFEQAIYKVLDKM
jgi:hypothetical protein